MPNINTILQRNLKQLDNMKRGMVRGLLKTLKKIDQEKAKRVADLEDAAKAIRRELADLGHKFAGSSSNGTARPATKPTTKTSMATRTRGRRSPEQMKAEAERMVKFIKSKGSEGATGGEIKKQFGPYQSVKQFVKEKAGITLKTKGQRAAMRYFAE